MARDAGGLDFLCLSEHNHMLTTSEMSTLLRAVEASTTNGIVALFGQEYSTIKKGVNHTGTVNYPLLVKPSVARNESGHRVLRPSPSVAD